MFFLKVLLLWEDTLSRYVSLLPLWLPVEGNVATDSFSGLILILCLFWGLSMHYSVYIVVFLPWISTKVSGSSGKWSRLSLLWGVGVKVGPYRLGALSCHLILGWFCSTTRVLSSTGVWSLQPYLAKLTLLLGIGMKVGPYTVGPSFASCDLGKGSFYNLYSWFPVSFVLVPVLTYVLANTLAYVLCFPFLGL